MSSFLSSVALYLALALGLILAGVALLSLRNPIIGKLGVRNIPRRPTQSTLIVFGLTLSTMIIISALSLGDTLENTIRRQTIDAYGQIDQVVSPPFLSDLIELAGGASIDPEDASSPQSAALLNALTSGDVNALIALFEEGLPGIPEQRYEQLREETASYPLIDGVAGSILFPTIVRNVSTGQGEPLGFIFAVDENYDTGFGLHDVDGAPVSTADLRPGIGDVFAELVGLWQQTGAAANEIGATLGVEDVGVPEAALAVGAAGAALLADEGPSFTLRQVAIPVETLRNLGIDTSIFDENGIETISLEGLGISDAELAQFNLDPDAPITIPTLPMLGVDVPNQQELLSAATEALGAINLNILGRDVDERLGQFGLQLRQGEVYLNKLGAQQLDARPGDLLEIFIGPIPVPYRVRAVVEEAGPPGALVPVVMMHTDEAQKLLFMPDRVNNILISNAGDAVSGMVHTEAVSDQLQMLSLNETRLAALMESLRKPEVAEVIRKESLAPVNPLFEDTDDTPQFLIELVGMWSQVTSFDTDIDVLAAAVAGPKEAETGAEVRAALNSESVQEWLTSLPLEDEDRTAVQAGLADIRDFDVLAPLSKQFVTNVAEVGGIAFGTLFSSFGILSIFAGVLLIFLIFVMLAAERRSELGIARAVGMRRIHLVQMFVTEGLVYDLAAALIGLGLGLLVSYGMIGFLSGLLSNISQRVASSSLPFTFHWHAAPTSLVIAYCLGVFLTFVVVTIASWNVSRLNIIAAIRNLPDTSHGKRQGCLGRVLRSLALLLLLGGGGYLIWLGREHGQTVAFMGGTLLLIGIGWGGGWLSRGWTPGQAVLRRRLVNTVIGVGLLALWAVPWNAVLDTDLPWFNENPGFTLLSFALSGPFIITGAIMVVMFNADSVAGLFVRLVGGIGPLTPVLKTAVAYPLSNRFRTGTAMLLFAMVITTVTVMSVVIRATEVATKPSEESTAGFDIVLSPGLLSFFDPVSDINEEAAKRADFPSEQVAVLGSVARMWLTARQLEPSVEETDSTIRADMTGIDEGYTRQAAQHYGFQMRAAGFNSDEEIWQALAERDDVAVVTSWWVERPPPEPSGGSADSSGVVEDEEPWPWGPRRLQGFFLEEGGTLPHVLVELSSRPDVSTSRMSVSSANVQAEISVSRPAGPASGEGAAHTVQIIGVLEDDETLAEGSLQMNRRALDILNGEPVHPAHFYAKTAPDADVGETALALERAMLNSGLNAIPLSEQFATGQAILRGILGLFQGFLALGLVVGIAGLGVISSRTVVERRQQIGVLRAIGYPSGTVALLFVLEANFIALTGILVGGITGLILGDKTIGQAYDLATQQSFPTPWLTIAGMLLAAWLFSLLTTILPAWQASRIYPAEALRYE